MLPAGLRTGLDGNTVYITRGVEKCLWMFTPKQWEGFKEKILKNSSSLSRNGRVARNHFLVPVQEIEIDKTGRINISQPLRDWAQLEKECSICVGVEDHIDIWNRTRYDEYIEENAAKVNAALESIDLMDQQ